MIKLIGVLIIVIGFILKLDTIGVVLTAGVVTGLVSGMGFIEILETIGTSFVNTRYMSIFFLTLPVVGIIERYGLKEQASELISKIKHVSAGKVLGLYAIIREIAAAMSLRLNGHVQFVRPLIYPMAVGAAESKYGELDSEDIEKIKGLSAAAENYGNFYAQNVFVASSGILLIVGTLTELGYEVASLNVAKASIPVAVIALILAIIQFYIFDKNLKKKYKEVEDNE